VNPAPAALVGFAALAGEAGLIPSAALPTRIGFRGIAEPPALDALPARAGFRALARMTTSAGFREIVAMEVSARIA
jgi:hypothetical protein